MVTSAQAVQLVVLSVNTTAVPGDKVFTIGVKVSQSDVTAPGAGNNPPLFAQGITFTGSANGPIQAAGSNNKQDVQTVQGNIDNDTSGNPQAPGGLNGPAAGFTAAATNTQLFKDSWWYSGATATLQGVIDSSGDSGTVTTNPATDGSGIYTISNAPGTAATGPGGTAAVGATGYLFQPIATGIVGGTTSLSTMSYSGLFGPTGANALDAAPLAGLFSGGFLTVPLAQIIASGNVAIPDTYNGGQGQFLSIGQVPYDLAGAKAGTDTPLLLNFATGTITGGTTPEPGTFLLAGMGALGLLLALRRRK
jgi:MYXO-CTERM domain-containing protein